MTKRAILRWRLPATALVLTSLLSGCGGASPSEGATQKPPASQRVSGYGLSISLPAGWDGRIDKRAPDAATVLQAGNFELPATDNDLGEKAVDLLESDSNGIYINIIDLGNPDPRWPNWVDAAPPISVSASDFGMFVGVGPSAVSRRSLARRWLIVNGHALIVLVSFGTPTPGDALLAEANDVLASLSLEAA